VAAKAAAEARGPPPLAAAAAGAKSILVFMTSQGMEMSTEATPAAAPAVKSMHKQHWRQPMCRLDRGWQQGMAIGFLSSSPTVGKAWALVRSPPFLAAKPSISCHSCTQPCQGLHYN
jgi:hypothetical protein